jgi:4-amino-4-deoxychorismate lyase
MSETETVFVKASGGGDWIRSNSLAIPNRGLNFGDGLFETMVFDKGEIRFKDYHRIRSKKGAELLELDLGDFALEEIQTFLNAVFPVDRFRIRWNIFRGGKGKYTPEGNQVVQTLQMEDFSPAPRVKRQAGISTQIKLYPTLWSGLKTLNALPYVLANQERKARGWDEIILLDHRGYVSEAGSSNIFWIKAGKVFTPSLACACLDGTGRKVIIEKMKDLAIPFEEGEYDLNELRSAEKIWTSNAIGISYLASINSVNFSVESELFLERLFQ